MPEPKQPALTTAAGIPGGGDWNGLTDGPRTEPEDEGEKGSSP